MRNIGEKGTAPVISQRAIHPRGFFIEAFLKALDI